MCRWLPTISLLSCFETEGYQPLEQNLANSGNVHFWPSFSSCDYLIFQPCKDTEFHSSTLSKCPQECRFYKQNKQTNEQIKHLTKHNKKSPFFQSGWSQMNSMSNPTNSLTVDAPRGGGSRHIQGRMQSKNSGGKKKSHYCQTCWFFNRIIILNCGFKIPL